jgi:superfamily II DNA or RNA helicase
MKIGTKIISKTYPEKGVGFIVSFSDFFGERFVEVQFQTGESFTLEENDIKEISKISDFLTTSEFASSDLFLSRLLSAKIDCLLTERELISSVNYKIQPLPHQLLTIDFVLNRYKPRCLIADEVGLGKTIEAILVYEELKLRGLANKVLIVVPSGLILQWQEELRLKFNETFIIYDNQYIKHLKQTYGKESNVWEHHNQIIASMDTIKPYKLKKDIDAKERKRREWRNRYIFEDIKKAGFDIVFFDEAHKLTKKSDGMTTSRYKLGIQLSEVIPIVLLLTATPHQGDESMFLNLLRIIDPITFKTSKSLTPQTVGEITVRNKKRAVVDFEGKRIFKHRITSLIKINRDDERNSDEIELYNYVTDYVKEYYGIATFQNNSALIFLLILYQRITASSSFAVLNTLRKRLMFINHLEEEIEKEFPNEESNMDELEDFVLHKRIWDNAEEIETEKKFITHCIGLAKKVSSNYGDEKFKKLIELIDEIKLRENNPYLKFIIFTEFRATQTAIIEYLAKFGYSSSYINGSLSKDHKVDQIESFRNESQILVSTDAGGEGINLQFCYCLINFDLPWNPTRLEQRIGRVDRIGQNKNVLIFNFQLTNTIDDYVQETLERKLKLIKEQFGEDKYSDVITYLQDEFSFEKLYLDALIYKEKEEAIIEQQAEELYNKAIKVLEKDEMILPFTNFSKSADALVDKKSNDLIKKTVFHYFKSQNLKINEYKNKSGVYFFDSPFDAKIKYRNIVFDNNIACNSEKYEFLNVSHPLLTEIRKLFNSNLGSVSSFKINSTKFKNTLGILFYFKSTITNNLDKTYKTIIPIFLENGDKYNSRISKHLKSLENFEIENYPLSDKFNFNYKIAETMAQESAKEILMDILFKKKMEWTEQINNFKVKAVDYYNYKKNAIADIPIENIRKSKLEQINAEQEKEFANLEKKKMIVPKLEIDQICLLEFI